MRIRGLVIGCVLLALAGCKDETSSTARDAAARIDAKADARDTSDSSAPANVDDLAALLEPLRATHGLPALGAAVVRGKRLVGLGVVGLRQVGATAKATKRDRFHVGSCTKSMTATVAGRLVDAGKIAWSTTVAKALPTLSASILAAYRGVTLTELLTHRSGMPGTPSAAVWSKVWALSGDMKTQRRDLVKLALNQPPTGKRGQTYSYANLGYSVAGAMLEAVSGKVWETLMQTELAQPLGLKTLGFGAPGSTSTIDQPRGHRSTGGKLTGVVPGRGADNPAAIGPAGTAHLDLADFAAYAGAHLRGARGESGVLLKPATFKSLHTPGGSKPDYAGGWLRASRTWAGGTVLTHTGSNTMWFAVMWIAPNKNVAFVAVTNVAGSGGSKGTDAAVAALVRKYVP